MKTYENTNSINGHMRGNSYRFRIQKKSTFSLSKFKKGPQKVEIGPILGHFVYNVNILLVSNANVLSVLDQDNIGLIFTIPSPQILYTCRQNDLYFIT